MEKELQRLVLVVVGTDSGETLERWTFHVHKEETPVVKDGRYERPACRRRPLIGVCVFNQSMKWQGVDEGL